MQPTDSDPPDVTPAAAVADARLAQLLDLPPGTSARVPDASRLKELLDLYDRGPLNDGERAALMSMIVAAYDRQLSESRAADYLPWGAIRYRLTERFDLHSALVRHWCSFGTGGGAGVAPLMREVWNTHLRFPAGVPEFEAFGFLSLVLVGSPDDFSNAPAAVATVAGLLDRSAQFVDADGFTDEITAGAVRPEGEGVAWVECRSRQHAGGFVDISYHLKARIGGRATLDWEVETYNPYFGCDVGYMAWQGERVVLIYREKHRTYAASVPLNGPVTRARIADEWMPAEEFVTFSDRDEPALVRRVSLPELTPLVPLTVDDARSAGLLPHNFDLMMGL